MEDKLITGEDGLVRCWWCGDDEAYIRYHDEEWGRPVTDDIRLFEKICLEGFQAGLSWLTILRKRENFRAAFDGFDFCKVATYGARDIERLLGDAGIIRHRGKIEATINNATRAIEMTEEFGALSEYFWSFQPGRHCEAKPKQSSSETGLPRRADALLAMTSEEIPSQTAESIALSKDLKKRGWKFVGPTTCYSFMQAMGMVNDHLDGCHIRAKIGA